MILARNSWRRSYAYVLVATAGLVAAADFFLYDGYRLGWTVAVVAAALMIVLTVRDWSFLRTTGGKVVALAGAGLLVALIEQPTWLNLLYALVCLAGITLINHFGWQAEFWPWAQRLGRWMSTAWTWFFHDNSVVARWLARRGISPTVTRAVAAWTLPILLSSVFVALFAWANPIISSWVGSAFDWIGRMLGRLPEMISFPRLVFWLAFAMLAWMLLRGPSKRWRQRSPASSAAAARAPARPEVVEGTIDGQLTLALVVRCLILFNVVFAIQNLLDLRYLYVDTEGLTALEYRTYVRRGAYPLVGAALLAGAFVLVTFRPGSATERSPAARGLVYAWIGQTILLTASASIRLVRYVEMSELTRLRVASAVWFILVALGLCFIIWRIVTHRSNAWLLNANALAALALLYPCCFINFDRFIADFNVAHCREVGGQGKWLDVEYFRTLGTPSLAALERVRGQLDADWRREQAQQISDELHAELRTAVNDWRSWTWRRHRSAREVEAVGGSNPDADRQLARSEDAGTQ